MWLRHSVHGHGPQVCKELGITRVFEFVCFPSARQWFSARGTALEVLFLEKRGSELLHLFVHSFG